MLVGDAISAAVPGTKEKPAIAPLVLMLTSAVTCCHQGLPSECKKLASFLRELGTVVRSR